MELNLRTFLGHQNLLVSFRPVFLPAENLGSTDREIPGVNPVSGAVVSGLRDDALRACVCVCQVASVMSDSFQPYGL